MQPVVIEKLVKTYRGKRGKMVEALKGIDLSVDQGEVFGFVGPNGAGKSTTIKILVGLLKATGGRALLCGKPAEEHSSRREVGFLPENPALYDFLTAREYLQFAGRTFGLNEQLLNKRCDEVLDLVDLTAAANRSARSYSKGMVQRLGIAQALVHDPQVYIFDEPMSGLDPLGRALVKEIILDLKQKGKTVFFSTHITADVEALCDRVGILIDGRLELVDTVSNIISHSINGYLVRVTGRFKQGAIPGGEEVSANGETREYFVGQKDFNHFIEQVRSAKGTIDSVDVKRKGIEDLFLEMTR